jgi:MarR-like DNA-binding transcriptional regulator SgrR of sgrS sRNA
MPSERYERYGKPLPPADPNQEFMTLQETAYVLNCCVRTVRRRLQQLGLHSKLGARVVTTKQDRLDLHDAGRTVPQQRRVRAAVKAAA